MVAKFKIEQRNNHEPPVCGVKCVMKIKKNDCPSKKFTDRKEFVNPCSDNEEEEQFETKNKDPP